MGYAKTNPNELYKISQNRKDNKVNNKRDDWKKDDLYTCKEVELYEIGRYVLGVGAQS